MVPSYYFTIVLTFLYISLFKNHFSNEVKV